MKIYDITQTIYEDMPVYKNRLEKKPRFDVVKTHEADGIHESRMTLELHTGTHLDAPLHILPSGHGIDKMPLEQFMGECVVLDLLQADAAIGWESLEHQDIREGDIVLLKTKNSYSVDFDPEFAYLCASGAIFLNELKVKGVGIDALGIERGQPDHDTHKLLMEAGVFILEGLALREVPPGRYQLLALPLKLRGAEASPVRAILMTL